MNRPYESGTLIKEDEMDRLNPKHRGRVMMGVGIVLMVLGLIGHRVYTSALGVVFIAVGAKFLREARDEKSPS